MIQFLLESKGDEITPYTDERAQIDTHCNLEPTKVAIEDGAIDYLRRHRHEVSGLKRPQSSPFIATSARIQSSSNPDCPFLTTDPQL